MADLGNLSATLSSGGDSAGTSAPAPAPQPEPTSNMPVGDTLTPPSSGGNLASTLQPAVNPKLNRTFMSTLKGIALGFMEGNIPGAIQGGIDPSVPQRVLQQKRDTAQANVTFANARAAHEVAMAHQADVEYQAFPEKLQQESEKRSLENMSLARQAGYLPIATVPLDQGQDQNSQGAMTALNSVKQQFGAVPSGLLYIHTGSGMTVMKLQDPAAALTTINQTRRAQGMPEIQQDAFMQLAPGDRDSMARDAINFADPRDINGMVTQNSINIATMRLATVKAQPEFNGKDALVKSLQQTVDHQKAVLDSGAQAEAQRKGQAVGTEATAAQPGTTAAKVSEIKATAGPEANAAGAKAEAVARGTAKGQMAGLEGQTDDFGNTIGLTGDTLKDVKGKEAKFTKDFLEPMGSLQKANMEFNRIVADPKMNPAEKVTGLLNAVGISFDPLKGKGARLSNDVILEHANARDIYQSALQKVDSLRPGGGGPITEQQVRDYARIAQGVVHDAYVYNAHEAQRQGLPVDFLPKAARPGQAADDSVLQIYVDAARGDQAKALNALKKAGYQ